MKKKFARVSTVVIVSIFASLLGFSGLPLSFDFPTNQRVASAANGQTAIARPQLMFRDAYKDFIVVGENKGYTGGMYIQNQTNPGQCNNNMVPNGGTNQFSIQDDSGEKMRVTFDKGGNIFVIWHSGSTGILQTYFARISADCSTWSGKINIGQQLSNIFGIDPKNGNPEIAYSPLENRIYAAIETPGNNLNLFSAPALATGWDTGKNWDKAYTNIVTNNKTQITPRMAVDNNANVHLLFSRANSSGYNSIQVVDLLGGVKGTLNTYGGTGLSLSQECTTCNAKNDEISVTLDGTTYAAWSSQFPDTSRNAGLARWETGNNSWIRLGESVTGDTFSQSVGVHSVSVTAGKDNKSVFLAVGNSNCTIIYISNNRGADFGAGRQNYCSYGSISSISVSQGYNQVGVFTLDDNRVDHFDVFTGGGIGGIPSFRSVPSSGSTLYTGAGRVGTSAGTVSIGISNPGTDRLLLSNPSFSGAFGPDFAITTPLFPAGIDPGNGPINLTVQCTPSQVGPEVVTLSFSTNDQSQPTPSYTIGCTGTLPTYVSSPAPGNTLNFGTGQIGTVAGTNSIAVSNPGSDKLTISNPQLGGSYPSEFSITNPTFPFDIAAGGGPVNITLQCIPGAASYQTANLALTTNDPAKPVVNYTLGCFGTPIPPSAPVGLAANVSNSPTVHLSWNANPNNLTGFSIERSLGSSGNFVVIGQSPANSKSFDDTTARNGTTYTYRIRAFNMLNNVIAYSPYSQTTTATTLLIAPSQLNGAAFNSSSPYSVVLYWNDNSRFEDGFVIERSTDNVTFTQVGTTTGTNITTYTDSTVDGVSSYYYRVRATSTAAGNSNPTAVLTVNSVPTYIVNSNTEDCSGNLTQTGQATLSYALTHAITPGQTIVFALPTDPATGQALPIVVNCQLPPLLPGVNLVGSYNTTTKTANVKISYTGTDTTIQGLIMKGNNLVYGLQLNGFKSSSINLNKTGGNRLVLVKTSKQTL